MKIKPKMFSEEMGYLFGICAVPVNLWTVYWMLVLVPSWIKSNTVWDFIGLLSYSLTFVLLEISVFFFALLLLRLIIPKTWGTKKFTAFGLLLLFEISIFVLLLQFNNSLYFQMKLLLIGFAGGLFLISLLIQFIPAVTKIFYAVANRLMILGYFFMIFNLLGMVIVFIRNVVL